MKPSSPAQITICMGSSCFSRGNNRNIEAAQDHLRRHPLPAGVELTGHLCEGRCKDGPNIAIDGRLYHQVDPSMLIGILSAATGREAG